MLTFLEVTSSN